MPLRRQNSNPDQLNFALPQAEVSGALHSHGLFSSNYLQRHFAQSPDAPPVSEIESLYTEVRGLWQEKLPGLIKQKEAYTRTAFLDPLLKALGWHFIPEADLPHGPTKKRPDYALFPESDRVEQAAAAVDATDLFRLADTVLESKRWHHPLDEVSTKETPGWFPSEQIQDYLRHAKDANGARFFNWAILTNGCSWRLYCEQAAGDSFFEFILAHGDAFCSLDDFRFFVALFRPVAFLRSEGRCLLDQLREEALTRQVVLEKNLKDRIFDVLEDLATGYRNCAENIIPEGEYPALYETSLVFLYRLLFILYAESRGLLPVKARGQRGNAIYNERYSLTRLVPDLKGGAKFTDDAFSELYDQLLKTFDLINGTNEVRNKAAAVTRYNGGLFNPHEHPRIGQWKVGDATLANVLRLLVFDQPAGANRRQRTIRTEDTIDYASLEVRQLGDIYEGLLGVQLADNAAGRLELINANGKNHRQGIFYTPDWVVLYLLRETLDPLLAEIDAGEDVQRALEKKNDEQRRDNSFALAVLSLRIIDPAMGSAHFLVRATEYLARKIREHDTTRLMTEQEVRTGGSRRTREQILSANRHPVPPGVSQEQAETAYWRRRVVESCIHGVDIKLESLYKSKDVTDTEFIALCRDIQVWAAGPPNGKRRASREAVGLRSSEDYTDANDAPRIATIYNGLSGRGRFVPFRKGDPDGNRWQDDEPLYTIWDAQTVAWLFNNSGKHAERMPVIRNAGFYFTAGLTYNIHARGVLLKSKLLRDCVFDASASMLCPTTRTVPAEHLLALFNSHVVSFYIKKFLNNTWHEISDLRRIPLVVPTAAQTKRIKNLVTLAFRAKRHELAGTHPDNPLVAAVRPIEAELIAHAPAYLHPGAQQKMLETADDCLAVIERAVSWNAEKLYGVEGFGPFDEF